MKTKKRLAREFGHRVDRAMNCLSPTKVWPSEVHDGAFQRSAEASLKRLGLDHVDLLLIHWPPKDNDIEGWAALLDEAVERGWTRHVGVSNFTTTLLRQIAAALKHPLTVNQVENHPYLDQSKLRDCCAELGMALIAYCPPFSRDDGCLKTRPLLHWRKPRIRRRCKSCCAGICNMKARVPSQKTATPSRVLENIDIFDFALSDQEMASLSALKSANSRLCDYDISPDWDRP